MLNFRHQRDRFAAPKRVGVLLGGRSEEREISLQSGKAMADALRRIGYLVDEIDVGDDICKNISETRIDVALCALHGPWGEDGCIQGLLESLRIPYSGSKVLASALAMNKEISKRLFHAADIRTPRWVYPVNKEAVKSLGFPLVLKPSQGGSSYGLVIVKNDHELETGLTTYAHLDLIAEEFIEGHELTVGVIGQGDDAKALGTLEIRPKEGLYNYEAKYNRDDTEYLVPAPLNTKAEEKLKAIALNAHRLLGCSGASRVDFRWEDPSDESTEPAILEINTLPGMTSHSLLPKIAAFSNISYDELVEWILIDAELGVA